VFEVGVSRTDLYAFVHSYCLLYREEEREMNNYCADQGIAVIPWSPLARGLLSGSKNTLRSNTDAAQKRWFGNSPSDAEIIERVAKVAEKRQCSSAQIALAWLYSKPGVMAPICGVTKLQYLDDLILASRIKLSQEEILFLEEPYRARQIIGHS
jgi:aryl-alcohol dehydrogenase-like predicted oxidoreductase